MSKEKEALGVRLAEISKKVDVVQFAAGGVIFLFSRAAGLVIMVGSAITWIAANEYQRRRRKGQQLATA